MRPRESIGGGLRRVLLDCLERAQRVAAEAEGSEVERVHEARLALKRVRAVLRLADACGLSWAQEARARIASLSRELGSVRDPTVVTSAARRLGSAVPIAGTASPTCWPEWGRRLAAERRRLSRCRWPGVTRAVCHAALAGSVQRLERRERNAAAGFDASRLHEWRKAVIGLREKLNVTRALLTRRQQSHAARLHEVARRLGTAQDLALLIAAAKVHLPRAMRLDLVKLAQRKRRRAVKQARRFAQGLTHDLRREFL
ncbi:MAG: CHAD domain-containing protein [Opitutales bacterium]